MERVRTILAVMLFVSFAAALLVVPQPAHACSCAAKPDIREELRRKRPGDRHVRADGEAVRRGRRFESAWNRLRAAAGSDGKERHAPGAMDRRRSSRPCRRLAALAVGQIRNIATTVVTARPSRTGFRLRRANSNGSTPQMAAAGMSAHGTSVPPPTQIAAI